MLDVPQSALGFGFANGPGGTHTSRTVMLNDLPVPPGNHLEKLAGDRAGQYSLRVNDLWRICFEWREGDSYQAEIADYH